MLETVPTSPAIAQPVAEVVTQLSIEADARGTRIEASFDYVPDASPTRASLMVYLADGTRPQHLDVPVAELGHLALALEAVADAITGARS